MEEERCVLLGVVQEKHGVDAASPYICKAGGRPAWYGNGEPSEVKSLVCPKCKQSLFLVAQVYAPVDADRTVYVFGCNSPECTETPGSWRVLRDQVAVENLPKTVPQVEAPAPKAPAPTSGWAAGDDDSDWSDDDDDAGAVGDAPSSGGAFDLESLLQQRDDAMKNPTRAAIPAPAAIEKANESKAGTTDANTNAEHTARLNAFPALSIDVISEPYEGYTKENDYSHENELLQAYMKSEEEEKSTDVSDLRRIIANSKKTSSDGGAAAGGASSGESYERTPAQQKHFMRFQKRINRCPLQVLRYDYGGEPLWPTPIQKNKIKVPRCPCGEDRSFELQLTPTINYFLKVDDYAQKKLELPQQTSASATASAATAAAATGGGMDWASVVVYSCPSSCPQSNEEYVFVLPPQP